MRNRTDARPRPTAEPDCRPWCVLHLQETDACASACTDVASIPGMSLWTSQGDAEPIPTIAVDAHDSRGRPFDLALTPTQAVAFGSALQNVARVAQ